MKPEIIDVEGTEDFELQFKTESKKLAVRIKDKFRKGERLEMFGCLWVIVEIEDDYSPQYSFSAILFSESI